VIDGAIEWAEATLGARVVACEQLTGGLTSTMLALTDDTGAQSVLRLMTEEPWRTHGRALTQREQGAQRALATTPVPAPTTLGLDAEGEVTGVSAHLMSRLPGTAAASVDGDALMAMSDMLATIHAVRPSSPFRTFQSWADEAKWVVPPWTQHAASWERAFDLLAQEPPAYEPKFIHRDFSHRNLLWRDGAISGVVDWVESSTGPACLDAGHAATNLAVAFDLDRASRFLDCYSATTGSSPDVYWLIMDAVGFLPPPGRAPMFASSSELARLDAWLHYLIAVRAP
jgi:aminoglycoside phosphotransferase (APT) family kinase protein